MLGLEHYSKAYSGGKVAVDDLSLHVQAGEIYGFMAAVALSVGAYAIGGAWAALTAVLILSGICTGILWSKGPSMLRKIL